MANIKFSAFTQKVVTGDVDFLVGYTGGDNVRISPAVFLGAYLPLAGGTMTGTTNHGDNVYSQWGTGTDFWMVHNGANTLFQNETGDLIISNNANNQDIQFKSDDGAGNQTLYYYLDGSIVRNRFPKDVYLEDDVKLLFGDATTPDLEIYHDASNSYITDTGTGSLKIGAANFHLMNAAHTEYMMTGTPDAGMILYYDNSTKFQTISAGVAVTGNVELPDGGQLQCGPLSGGDLKFYWDTTDGNIINKTGHLYIKNQANDKDIIFESDDGAGGTTPYMTIDGGAEQITIHKNAEFQTSVQAQFGSSGDMQLWHDGNNGSWQNDIGHMYIRNTANDKSIYFLTDDGAGGYTTYFFLDGGTSETNDLITTFPDYSSLCFGDGRDFKIYHDTTDTTLKNQTGHLYIINTSDDKNIYFQTDDGGGGVTTYMKVDGLSEYTQFDKAARFMDNVHLQFGNSNDAGIYHNGTDMIVTNYSTDGDMNFRADNGAGSVTNYFHLDGGVELTRFSKGVNFGDNVKLTFGDVATPGDLEIYHDTSNSYIRETGTGNMYIQASERIRFTGINDEALLYLNENSNVEAYYDAALKLETTATGTKTTGQMDIAALNTAPANAADTGTLGEIRYTADYIYVCTATDTWKRAALSTW